MRYYYKNPKGKGRTIRLFPNGGGWSVWEVCCTGGGSQICDERPQEEARAAFEAAVRMWGRFAHDIKRKYDAATGAVTVIMDGGAR